MTEYSGPTASECIARYPRIMDWIKCSERLPDVGAWVLCYGSLANGYEVLFRGEMDGSKYTPPRDDAWGWKDDDDAYYWAENVTHWMPLPAPPDQSTLGLEYMARLELTIE